MKKATKNSKLFKSKGFSLLEMSVVIVTSVTIMATVAAGVGLVNKARLGDVITDITNFTQAISRFENRFEALPGDISDVSVINGASASSAGNGNGIIDANEALNLWRHLYLANILKTKFDGSSQYIPGKGVPSGAMKQSGYKIYDPSSNSSIPDQAIVIQFSGFSSSIPSSDLPILSPEDAKSIDLKIDDGDPNTGAIRGLGSDCIASDVYNISNKSLSCSLLFIIRSHIDTTEETIVTGSCSEIGATRESPDQNQTCPPGTRGKIIETCQLDSSETPVWKISDRNCSPVLCAGGKPYGSIRSLGCINGQQGSGLLQTCGEGGIWFTDSSNSNCATLSANPASTCPIVGQIRDPQACGWGEKGVHYQKCNVSSQWETDTQAGGNTCVAIKCGTNNIGDTKNSSTACGQNHVGTVYETCTTAGTWQITHNNCKPQYSGGCTSGQTRDISCPPGETGLHTQECIESSSNYWTTKLDTCKPVTCDGYPIGTARPAKGQTCPTLSVGVVIEICGSDGNWVNNSDNCTPAMCYASQAGNGSTAGHATWPNAIGGTSNISGTCDPGYDGTATRNCNSDNTWAVPTSSCTRRVCSSLSNDNNASWPATNATINDAYGNPITSLATGTCLEGYEEAGGTGPTRECKNDGTWDSSITNPCTTVLVVTPWGVSSGLRLWLDAEDPNNDGGVVIPNDNSAVATWYDKSGYGNNAIRVTAGTGPLYQHSLMNSRNVMQFSGDGYYYMNYSADLNPDKETTFYHLRKNDNGSQILFSNFNLSSSIYNGYYVNTYTSTWWGLTKGSTGGNYNGVYDNRTASGVVFTVTTLFETSDTGTTNGYGTICFNGTDCLTSTGGYQKLNAGYTSRIGRYTYYATERYLYADLAEVIRYKRILTTSERSTVRTYLQNKWGP